MMTTRKDRDNSELHVVIKVKPVPATKPNIFSMVSQFWALLMTFTYVLGLGSGYMLSPLLQQPNPFPRLQP
jgi:hypothetical protein